MKTHLYDSTEPATEFVTIKALCGTNVHKAAFVTQGEEDQVHSASQLLPL